MTKGTFFLLGAILGGLGGWVVSKVFQAKVKPEDRYVTEHRIAQLWSNLYVTKACLVVDGFTVGYEPDSLYFWDEELLDDTTRDDLIDTVWISTSSGFQVNKVAWSRWVYGDYGWELDTTQSTRPDLSQKRRWAK